MTNVCTLITKSAAAHLATTLRIRTIQLTLVLFTNVVCMRLVGLSLQGMHVLQLYRMFDSHVVSNCSQSSLCTFVCHGNTHCMVQDTLNKT